jgi:hypothetical protein
MRRPTRLWGSRPPDVLAKRLFDLGATKVTVYSNVVTAEAPASAWRDIEPKVTFTIEHLFEFYGERRGLVLRSPRHGSPVSKVE